jgi:type II restriction enzyme
VWYEKALRGKYADLIGDKVLQKLSDEIQTECPSTDKKGFDDFISKRGYKTRANTTWL